MERGQSKKLWPEATKRDINRLMELCRQLRAGNDDPWLCGKRGLVDAFFAPIMSHFRTYAVMFTGSPATHDNKENH
jgi:glutathione S-transferase